MATERLSMRKTREILRHKWVLGLGYRDVASSVDVSLGGVWLVVDRAKKAGLDWPTVEALDDAALEARVHTRDLQAGLTRPIPDCARIDLERRRVGVTLELLHLEYVEQNPDGYSYSQFCEYYRRWLGRHRLSMRQVYRAGEKGFVDYSGKRPCITDAATGEKIPVELFVAVLGASSFTYAEATLTQKSRDFIASHVRAMEYWGGAPMLLVPDQLRSGVSKPHRYEPEIQRTYEEMGEHYGVAVLPARPRSPRDKPKVEVAVQIAQRWIVARMRNETFFSLAELNERIAKLLEDLNNRVMRRYGKTRRQLFEELDRPALRPLPAQRFVWGDWKNAGVNIDYHIDVEHHYYSVPFTLVHERGGCAFHRQHSGDLLQEPACGFARAQLRAWRVHPRTQSTCRKSTATTPSGRRHACSGGPRRSDPRRRNWSPRSSTRSRTPSTGTAPAWASCDWADDTASHDLRRPVPAL
jgi:transposase